MPYRVGAKGSYGCSGYPVLKEGTSEVMGCHDSAEKAQAQIAAININENKSEDSTWETVAPNSQDPGLGKAYEGCGCPTCKELNVSCENCPVCQAGEMKSDCCGNVNKKSPCWDGYVMRGMKPGKGGSMVPNCVPVSKADAEITEGDFVIAMTSEGPVVGQVEHVMREGGTYGQPENPYSVRSTPENPAVAIRILEEDDGTYYYTPYSIGALMSDVNRINMPNISMEDYEDKESMLKAEGYSPPAGARNAAKRAIRWKKEGKAKGAGTVVGWTRAGQLARGETLSLSTVKRMYSYFSRHEVDKKGKDFYNTSNPSNGRIMWDAWGGDAGFSWSKRIAQRESDKALFAESFNATINKKIKKRGSGSTLWS